MSNKSLIWLGASVGSIIGEAIPGLWGAGFFSAWGILTGAVGGILGIWLAYKLTV